MATLWVEGLQNERQIGFCGVGMLEIVFDGPEERGRVVFGGWRRLLGLDFFSFPALVPGMRETGRHNAVRFHELFRDENGIAYTHAPGVDIRVGFDQAGPVRALTGIPKGDGKKGFAMIPDFVDPHPGFRRRPHCRAVLSDKVVQRLLGNIGRNV